MRYILDISYKGTKYHGWQIQANAHAVQAELNGGLKKLLGEEISTIGSGRTDTGVHAEQQIVQFDFNNDLNLAQTKYKLNLILPKDISVNKVLQVVDTFSARFDALSRTYQYRIIKRKEPFCPELTYYFTLPLNVSLMNEAAQMLLKFSDYQCFSKSRTNVDHFLCNIFKAEWIEDVDKLTFEIKANRFLRGMVRAIVGTLLNVGLGKISLEDFEAIIKSKDRKLAGMSVPPQGLFLTAVEYPKALFVEGNLNG